MTRASIVEVGDARALDVAIRNAAGQQLNGFDPARPDVAVITAPATGATDVVLVAANPARKRVLIYNDSGKTLNVAFGVAASPTVFTFPLASKDLYDSGPLPYTGAIHGILPAGTGVARVTDLS